MQTIEYLTLALVIVTAILAVITGIYAWLTHKLVKENQKANTIYREATEKQYQLLTFPHMYLNIDNRKMIREPMMPEKAIYQLFNSSDAGAYDVSLLFVGLYLDERITPNTFWENYLNSDKKHQLTSADSEGWYGLKDYTCYPLFPPRKKVEAALGFPLPPESIVALLQFRDNAGNNYLQGLEFFKEKEGYVRLESSAMPASQGPRISWGPAKEDDYSSPMVLRTDDNSPIPEHISKLFLGPWEHSIFTYLGGPWKGDVDRGKWV